MRALLAVVVLLLATPVAAQPLAAPNSSATSPVPAGSSLRGSSLRGSSLPKSWLGVGIRNGLSGAVVSEVIPGSPARDAGLLAGDEIVAVAGTRVTSSTALSSNIGARAAGQKVELHVLRRGHRLRLPVVLDLLPNKGEILQLRLGNRPAPRFSLPIVLGRSGRLRDYDGRVVVLLFWSKWDLQSTALLHPLSKLAHRFGSDELEVIGISADSVAMQQRFLLRNKLPITLLHDPQGGVRTRDYRTNALATLVVIDRKGIVRYAGIGAGQNVDLAVFAAERATRDR